MAWSPNLLHRALGVLPIAPQYSTHGSHENSEPVSTNNMLDEKSTRITKFEECAFSVIYKKKLFQSKDKFVYVHNQHGRPSRLISIPKPELGSSKASSSSIRKRSAIVETVLSSVSEPSTSKKEDQADNALTDDKIFQEASLIKRDKPYLSSLLEKQASILSHGSI